MVGEQVTRHVRVNLRFFGIDRSLFNDRYILAKKVGKVGNDQYPLPTINLSPIRTPAKIILNQTILDPDFLLFNAHCSCSTDLGREERIHRT
ncbi:hypothetical protein I312_106409 [Cryptococcus bacillisporus CA1280]|uniref:uncharacterized protein n=1 Tax=Cryptococcus bacillisporus CA1280 TaxID=1296109 RepID=UPI003366525F